jgi:hypothetical protein
MPWRAFLMANATGGVIWPAVFGLGSFIFGKALLQLHHALAPIVFALALAIGIAGPRRRAAPTMQINVCSLTHVTTIIVPSALRLERTSAERQCQSA